MVTSILILSGCAVVMPPSGGPPDLTPPFVERSSVPHGLVNAGRSLAIELTFSEYVERSEVERSIIINPSAHYYTTWSGRTLTIVLDSLHGATTYQVSLAPAYHDLHGTQANEPFSLVFSTGNHLDSCQIKGTITGGQMRPRYVVLIPRDTSRLQLHYRVPAGTHGTFLADGLPCEEFIVTAFADANNNGMFDSGEECSVAFKPVQASFPPPTIRLWLEQCWMPRPISITSVRAITNRRLQVRSSALLSRLTTSDWHVHNQQTGDTISILAAFADNAEQFVLITATPLDTGIVYRLRPSHTASITDTLGNLLTDTNGVEFAGISTPDTLQPYLKSFSPNRDTTFDESLLPSLELIWSDGLRVPPGVELRDTNNDTVVPVILERRDDAHFIARPRDSLRPATVYQWIVRLDSAQSWSGRGSQDTGSVVRTIITLDTRQGGSVRGIVQDSCCHCRHIIVVARPTKGGIIGTTVADTVGNFVISYLPEGEYYFDAYCDANNNGRYDSGSIEPLRFGERIATDPIRAAIKARWTTDGVMIRLAQ